MFLVEKATSSQGSTIRLANFLRVLKGSFETGHIYFDFIYINERFGFSFFHA